MCARARVCVCACVHSLGAGGAWQTQHLWVRETCILLGAGSSPPSVPSTGALGSGGTSSPDPLRPGLPAVGVGGQPGRGVTHLTWEDGLYCSERLASVDSTRERPSCLSFPRTCSCGSASGPHGRPSSQSQPRVFLLGSPVGSGSSSVHSGLFLTSLPMSGHAAAQAGPSAPVLLASGQPLGTGLEPWSLAPAWSHLLSHPGLQGTE